MAKHKSASFFINTKIDENNNFVLRECEHFNEDLGSHNGNLYIM